MSLVIVLAIATALAMDAFSVSLVIAVSLANPTKQQTFRLAFNFGFSQFLMPIIGWFAGRAMLEYIQGFDHWIAFGLLAFVGGKMMYEAAVMGRNMKLQGVDPTKGISLIALSLATSIDALAVGISLSLINVRILLPAVIIGIVAFVLTGIGMVMGPFLGRLFGKRIEAVGGAILILIGLKILVEHLYC